MRIAWPRPCRSWARRLEKALGRGWLDGEEVSMEMFDGLFGSVEQPASWVDVQRTAALMGLGPADILRNLCQMGSTV